MREFEIGTTLRAAVEASVFVAPTDHGLTVEELIEVAGKLGLGRGEVTDNLRYAALQRASEGRLVLNSQAAQHVAVPVHRHDPENRDIKAFDFLYQELNAIAKDGGIRNATIERRVLLERARRSGVSTHGLEVAIAFNILSGFLVEDEIGIRYPNTQQQLRVPPSSSFEPPGAPNHVLAQPDRSRAMPVVRDVIERRTDGRPRHAEALPAFAEYLHSLGYGDFRMWWTQLASELSSTNATTSPVTAIVLSAALVEGALIFVVKRARGLNIGLFGSNEFDGASRSWKLKDLINGAARGSDPILPNLLKVKVETLAQTRQRIHAGAMLEEFPTGGAPDLRPEDAREAKSVAEQVVRAVIDWLHQHSAGATPP
jgi:hypothetical protein